MIELGFNICAPTDAVDTDFSGAVRVLGELGIEWCELRQIDGKRPTELTAAEHHDVVSVLHDAGVSVAMVASTVGQVDLDTDFGLQLNLLRRQIDVAKTFDAVRLCVTPFLVDDHEMVRRGLERLLSEDTGIAVVASLGDGEQALATIGETPADVIVLDISLPGLSGIQVLERLRASHPKLPVLMLI